MANNTHSVLHNAEYDTYSVHSQNSSWYITLLRSGKYAEIMEGTKKECDEWVEENTTSDIDRE